MSTHKFSFEEISLENRLGQEVALGVKLINMSSRDYLFVQAPENSPSSLVAKNAEHFAHQLVRRFKLDPQKCDIVEMRPGSEGGDMLRWRFEWVGSSALAARSQNISKGSQRDFIFTVLAMGLELPVFDKPDASSAKEKSAAVA